MVGTAFASYTPGYQRRVHRGARQLDAHNLLPRPRAPSVTSGRGPFFPCTPPPGRFAVQSAGSHPPWRATVPAAPSPASAPRPPGLPQAARLRAHRSRASPVISSTASASSRGRRVAASMLRARSTAVAASGPLGCWHLSAAASTAASRARLLLVPFHWPHVGWRRIQRERPRAEGRPVAGYRVVRIEAHRSIERRPGRREFVLRQFGLPEARVRSCTVRRSPEDVVEDAGCLAGRAGCDEPASDPRQRHLVGGLARQLEQLLRQPAVGFPSSPAGPPTRRPRRTAGPVPPAAMCRLQPAGTMTPQPGRPAASGPGAPAPSSPDRSTDRIEALHPSTPSLRCPGPPARGRGPGPGGPGRYA